MKTLSSRIVLLSVIAGAAVGAGALAQSAGSGAGEPPRKAIRGSADKPLGAGSAAASGPASQHSTTHMTIASTDPSTSIASAAAALSVLMKPACALFVSAGRVASGSIDAATLRGGAIATRRLPISARLANLLSRVIRTADMPVAPSDPSGAATGSTQEHSRDAVP